MAKKKKVRVDLRKNRSKPPRDQGWTKGFQDHGFAEESARAGERVRAKGDLSRRRTIMEDEKAPVGEASPEAPSGDANPLVRGRVLRVHGLYTIVEADDGRLFRCSVRRVLRTRTTDERSLVTTGDLVWFLPTPSGDSGPVPEGVIERVEPRHGLLTRASRRREHVLVANVDQAVIVMSLREPDLKPHLIDRYLASTAMGGLRPIICLNKADLIEPAGFQPLVGLYSQMGVPTLLTSARTGRGVAELRGLLRGRQTVFSGQSGVGKSSLLNAVQPELGLRVREVSEVNQKGKHTTTTAELIRLDFGGWVVDTPGIRQLELWSTRPEEMEGFFVEFRPFVALCAFPDCTHTHEDRCGVKRAVERRQVSASRYHSYLGLFQGEGT